jgi:hypothetical protein
MRLLNILEYFPSSPLLGTRFDGQLFLKQRFIQICRSRMVGQNQKKGASDWIPDL